MRLKIYEKRLSPPPADQRQTVSSNRARHNQLEELMCFGGIRSFLIFMPLMFFAFAGCVEENGDDVSAGNPIRSSVGQSAVAVDSTVGPAVSDIQGSDFDLVYSPDDTNLNTTYSRVFIAP